MFGDGNVTFECSTEGCRLDSEICQTRLTSQNEWRLVLKSTRFGVCLDQFRPNLTPLNATQIFNTGMSGMIPKLGQIGPKWDKSGTL